MTANTSSESSILESIVEQLPSEFRAKTLYLRKCPIQLYYKWESQANPVWPDALESQTLRVTAARSYLYSKDASNGKIEEFAREVGTVLVSFSLLAGKDLNHTHYVANLSFADSEPKEVPFGFTMELTQLVWEAILDQAIDKDVRALFVEALPDSEAYKLAKKMGFQEVRSAYAVSSSYGLFNSTPTKDLIPGSTHTYRMEVKEYSLLAWHNEGVQR